MEQNHDSFTPEAATDEPVSPFNPGSSQARSLPPRDGDRFAFASEAEAYWAGVANGIRSEGGIPAPRLAARARDRYPELVATAEQRRDADILEFDPVSVRHRIDGWTPQKQREFVEAFADSGVVRHAAARVGMSEQSVNRLRRRPDARAFDRACEAAMRIGARRLVSVAFERAIEGTIKRHHYHGEVVSEERVYDNRLLMALIGKFDSLFAPAERTEPVERDWQPWMEAIEQGLSEPASSEVDGPVPSEAEKSVPRAIDDETVWEEDGALWTSFPPPEGYRGREIGAFGPDYYCRTLTAAEQAAVEAWAAREDAEILAEQTARRDRYFGFPGDAPEARNFPLKGPEPSRPSEPCELCETSSAAECANGQAAMS